MQEWDGWRSVRSDDNFVDWTVSRRQLSTSPNFWLSNGPGLMFWNKLAYCALSAW